MDNLGGFELHKSSLDSSAPVTIIKQQNISMVSTSVMVIVEAAPTVFLDTARIDRIICHRSRQFLVRWKVDFSIPENLVPHSWHSIQELKGTPSALPLVQDYLTTFYKTRTSLHIPIHNDKKRKTSPLGDNISPRSSKSSIPTVNLDRSLWSSSLDGISRSSSVVPIMIDDDEDSLHTAFEDRNVYNCHLQRHNGELHGEPVDEGIDSSLLPTPAMTSRALAVSVAWAEESIRNAFHLKLAEYNMKDNGTTLLLTNNFDGSVPPLRFEFITDYVYLRNDLKPDPDLMTGCNQCKPNMAHNVGCEYSRLCECLEYVDVMTGSLREDEIEAYERAVANELSTIGFPKKFPYKLDGTLQARTLESRGAIYECNDNCACGSGCKTRVTQRRRIAADGDNESDICFEIFKTFNRGWGLRCTTDIRRGQFVDFYLGEVLDKTETNRREEEADVGTMKDNYLFDLDKFAHFIGDEHILTIDGQYMSGPTRFMNHSCEPNCAQYCVSYSRNDYQHYNLVFFATEDISAGEELTFDYADGMPEEETEALMLSSQQGEKQNTAPCLCGSKNCRNYIWNC